MSDTDTMGGLAAQDSYDPFAAEQFVPPAAADWAKQAAPQDVATLRTMAQPVMGALAAPGQALASSTPISSEQMIAPAAGIAGLTTLGAGAAPATANELRMGIKAYHGSPHDFDKFDLSKIGTGEGAQAYGHGLYFAENEGVARSYRDALAPQLARDPAFWADKNLPKALTPPENNQLTMLGAKMRAQGNLPTDEMQTWQELYNRKRTRDDAIEAMKPKGKMYEVNINADPAHFLDWDKPLLQMSPEVQQRLNDAWLAHPEGHSRQSGAQIYEASRLVPGEYRDPIAASKTLSEAGIPGIKYLDQGSRFNQALYNDNPIANEARKFIEAAGGNSEKAGELFHKSNPVERWAVPERDEIRRLIQTAGDKPTSNYVVFNPDIIKILRKYGLAGAAPAGIGALAAQDQYQQ